MNKSILLTTVIIFLFNISTAKAEMPSQGFLDLAVVCNSTDSHELALNLQVHTPNGSIEGAQSALIILGDQADGYSYILGTMNLNTSGVGSLISNSTDLKLELKIGSEANGTSKLILETLEDGHWVEHSQSLDCGFPQGSEGAHN